MCERDGCEMTEISYSSCYAHRATFYVFQTVQKLSYTKQIELQLQVLLYLIRVSYKNTSLVTKI